MDQKDLDEFEHLEHLKIISNHLKHIRVWLFNLWVVGVVILWKMP